VEQGILHANFKLSKSGEQVVVFGYDATEVIDSISYEEVPRDFTFGRITDGNIKWHELLKPTPKGSNIFTEIQETSFYAAGFHYKVYPNPASDEAIFNVNLNEPTRLIIKVYSSVGKLVSIPIDKYYLAGNYDIIWDLKSTEGDRLSHGIYFYTIETEAISIQDKLIIINW
jgi:hypothetical protein